MNANFLLNDHGIAYLIHGQPFCLEYQSEGCWFLIINYNNGESFFRRPHFRKPNGKFNTVTNVYSPEITVWGVGWGIKRLFHKRLKINFFNPLTQTIRALTPDLPSMPEFNLSLPQIEVHQQPVSIKSAAQPRLLTKEFNITQVDDYSTYKANHQRNNTTN